MSVCRELPPVCQIAYEDWGRGLSQERVNDLFPEMLCWFGLRAKMASRR